MTVTHEPAAPQHAPAGSPGSPQRGAPPAPHQAVTARGRPAKQGDGLHWWVEVLLIAAFYGVYSAIRNANGNDPAAAFHHAVDLIRWQRAIGLFHEPTLQQWALDVKPLVVFCNYFYGSLHFVVTGAALLLLFVRYRDRYRLWRNTLAVTTALALIGFTLWPLMPPRLLPARFGFVDTLARYPTFWSFDSGTVSRISNQFAAMPSVHCAWSLWCAIVLVPRLQRRSAKALAAAYPVVTLTAIVLTGNHYVLDAVGGYATLGLGYLLARTIEGWRARRRVPELDLTTVAA